MRFGVAGEAGAQPVRGDRTQGHAGHRFVLADDQCRDRVEVLAIGLHGVRRGLSRAAISQERLEPRGPAVVAGDVGRWGRLLHVTSISWIMAIIHGIRLKRLWHSLFGTPKRHCDEMTGSTGLGLNAWLPALVASPSTMSRSVPRRHRVRGSLIGQSEPNADGPCFA
jgi:hypothetical protein